MKNKFLTWILVIVFIVSLGGLFYYPRTQTNPQTNKWEEAGIDCLTMGHQRLSQHFHPHLTVEVDETGEIIPADIGLLTNCMAEIHTHDSSGTIHVEAASGAKEFRLGQFFAVWGKSIERPGYTLEATVDGQLYTEAVENLILKDKQQIVLKYKKNAPSTGEGRQNEPSVDLR